MWELRHDLQRLSTRGGEEIARVVRGAPPAQLERLMASPARHAILATIFSAMPRYLRAGPRNDVSGTARWVITAGHASPVTYDLEVERGRCRTRRGGGATEPRVTVTVEGTEFLRIAAGSSDPMRAYFQGRLRLSGDPWFAAKLVSLFRQPGS